VYQNLELFRVSGQMATHAGARQAVVARNIANADTPGYRAQAIAPFNESYTAGTASAMRATRASHIGGGMARLSSATTEVATEPAPNGNSVSLEQELLRGIDTQREHSRALAIYRHTMTVLRTAIGPGS